MAVTIDPEPLEHDASGLPFSARYGDRYASRAGALGQARHVFLGGNRLPARWAGRRQFVILETGFGLGNNFLATWQAWRADPARPELLHFVSVEKHPLAADDIASGGARFGAGAAGEKGWDELRASLAAQWPPLVGGLHRLAFDDGNVVLTLALGDARDLVPQLALGADAFYLDGFAPDRNPHMWDAALLRALARLARPEATLATYSAASSVRNALHAQGFAMERVPGHGLKRHMLRGQYAPRWKSRRHEPPAPHTGPRRAIIVGAGLAGCSTALALAQRGWQVTLLESGSAPASGASGLPLGLVYPLLSVDDNLASRLSRAAFAFACKTLASAAAHPQPAHGGTASSAPWWNPCGVFQQAADAQEESALRERLRQDAWPESFLRFEDAATAARHLGARPRHGGIWFAGGAAVDAGRWCHALLARARHAASQRGGALELECGWRAARLWQDKDQWHLSTAGGAVRAAPVLVLANAADLAPLLGLAHLPLQALNGCLSLIDAAPLAHLRAAVGGDGYVVPPLGGPAGVGATFEAPASLPWAPGAGGGAAPPAEGGLTEASAANLRRLDRLLHDPPQAAVVGEFRAARCVSQDRLPLAGAIVDEAQVMTMRERFAGAQLADLPRRDGLHCLAALGSRGLTLAPLLGELLAARIAGEPAPLDAALCAALDPGRFLLRHLRAPATAQVPATHAAHTGARSPQGMR